MVLKTLVDGSKLFFPKRNVAKNILLKGDIIPVILEFDKENNEIYITSNKIDTSGEFFKLGKISKTLKRDKEDSLNKYQLLEILKDTIFLDRFYHLNAVLIGLEKTEDNYLNFILEIEI